MWQIGLQIPGCFQPKMFIVKSQRRFWSNVSLTSKFHKNKKLWQFWSGNNGAKKCTKVFLISLHGVKTQTKFCCCGEKLQSTFFCEFSIYHELFYAVCIFAANKIIMQLWLGLVLDDKDVILAEKMLLPVCFWPKVLRFYIANRLLVKSDSRSFVKMLVCLRTKVIAPEFWVGMTLAVHKLSYESHQRKIMFAPC